MEEKIKVRIEERLPEERLKLFWGKRKEFNMICFFEKIWGEGVKDQV